MPGERKPGWFWALDRWSLAIAGVIFVVLVAASAAALLQEGATGLSGLSSPPAVGQSPLPIGEVRGARAADVSGLPDDAMPPSPAETAAATDAAGTSALRQGVVTGAPANLQGAGTDVVGVTQAGTASPSTLSTVSTQPTASARATSAAPLATRTPVRLGNLTVLPPVFVPEAAWPISRYGAPALGSLTGTAPSGVVVRIYDGSAQIGHVLAGVDNEWRFPIRSSLQPGRHILSAAFDYTDTLSSASGGASETAAASVTVSSPATIVFSVPVIVSAFGQVTTP